MASGRPLHAAAKAPVALPLPGSALTAADTEVLAAEFEGERPGRRLNRSTGRLVNTIAVLLALLVIWQVFMPLHQGSQYYLMLFLGGVLPLHHGRPR